MAYYTYKDQQQNKPGVHTISYFNSADPIYVIRADSEPEARAQLEALAEPINEERYMRYFQLLKVETDLPPTEQSVIHLKVGTGRENREIEIR